MSEKIKNILGYSLAFGVLIFAFSVFAFVGAYSKASEPAKGFLVSATGEVVAVPDIAEFNYAVVTEGGDDLIAIQNENTRKSNEINSYLKEKGIDEEDIRTAGYNIYPRYQSVRCAPGEICPPSEIVGYTVNHSVRVKVRDMAMVGEILSGTVRAGANSTSGLAFSIDDIESIKNEARDKAIQEAKEKAKTMADSAGFKIGAVISISENFYYPFASTRSAGMEVMDSYMPEPPSIEPGSEEVQVSVTIRYEIR